MPNLLPSTLVTPASAAHLAFHAARIAFVREALTPALEVAWPEGPPVTTSEIIRGMHEAAKPVRITGALTDAILRLRLSEVSSDQDASQRFEVRHRNSGDGPPLPRGTPRDALILVVAFDKLLKIADQTWREFARNYWVDGPLGWSGGEPSSEWAQTFHFPSDVIRDVGGIVHIGYSTGTGLRSAFLASAWGG